MKLTLLTTLVFWFLATAMPESYAQTCYPTELTVAQDGSGNYKTIQEAINSVRDLGQNRVKILIRKGVYNEKVVIPVWKTAISLIGESPESIFGTRL
jgi:pectinesterase